MYIFLFNTKINKKLIIIELNIIDKTLNNYYTICYFNLDVIVRENNCVSMTSLRMIGVRLTPRSDCLID